MEIQLIIIYILLSLAVISASLLLLNLRKYLRISQERLLIEKRNQEIDYEIKREEVHSSRNKRKQEESESRYLPRLLEEIPYLVEKTIRESQRRDYHELTKIIDCNLQNISDKIKSINVTDYKLSPKQLIKEISHSLNTPFSLIEVTVDNMLGDHGIEQSTAEHLETIKSSINICKSFLASFRELTLIASSSSLWNPESLVEALESAIAVYQHKIGKTNRPVIDLPRTVDGFSNNFILSLLLPLVENAIESAQAGTEITIAHKKNAKKINLTVCCIPDTLPQSDVIYDTGFTTKNDHDGLGLTIVRHLLESQSNSELFHIIADNHITFTITLIGRG